MKSGLTGVSARWFAPDATVLAFHRVGMPSPTFRGDHSLYSIRTDDFRQLMLQCRERFTVLPLNEIFGRVRDGERHARPAIAITFDDGYRDNFEVAAAILTELDLPATFFISPGLIDDPHGRWWDTIAALSSHGQIMERFGFSHGREMLHAIKTQPFEKSSHLLHSLREFSRQHLSDHSREMMSWDMVRELHQRGFEIGAHTLTHRVLSTLSLPEQQAEIMESKNLPPSAPSPIRSEDQRTTRQKPSNW
jgi:hypothetical protein